MARHLDGQLLQVKWHVGETGVAHAGTRLPKHLLVSPELSIYCCPDCCSGSIGPLTVPTNFLLVVS
jgi:hypothetical protein